MEKTNINYIKYWPIVISVIAVVATFTTVKNDVEQLKLVIAENKRTTDARVAKIEERQEATDKTFIEIQKQLASIDSKTSSLDAKVSIILKSLNFK